MDEREIRARIDNTPKEVFAERIKQARRDSGLTQDQLAEKYGSTRPHLIGLEKGRHRPRVDTLNRLAKALDVDVDYFLEAGDARPFRLGAAA